jgi:hypothetical protein
MPDIVTGITAGSSLLGAAGGSKGSGGGTTTSQPWKEQVPYLKYGFDQAKNAYQTASANPVYDGQRVAGLNPMQTGGADWLGNYTQNLGFGGTDLANLLSQNMLGQSAMYGQNANQIFQRAGQDPTQTILNQANQFANNPYVDSLINASGRDVTRQLFERDLPGINRAATGTGNLNSTRAGVESAIATRGAADRLADMSGDIRSKFFGQGLTMGQNQWNSNLSNMLNANAGLYNAYNSGLGGLNTSQNLAAGNFDALNAAGGMYSNYNQALLNSDMQRFAEQRDMPLDLISKYKALIDGNYGGATTAPTTGGGFLGALQGGLGGATSALGTLGKLKGTGIFGM